MYSKDVKSPLLLNSSSNNSATESDYTTNPADFDDELDVDRVLSKVGSWGKFNICLVLAFTFCHMTVIFQLTFSYFIGNNPPWKCVSTTNNTLNTNSNETLDFCSTRGNKEVHIDNKDFYERCNLPRNSWTYTTSKKYSYTTEFDFVCHRTLLGAMFSAAFFCGFLLNIFVAPAVDKFGRKYVVMVILFVGIVTSLLCSLATEVWQLLVLRFVEGGAFTLTSNIFFVHLIEFATPASRSVIGCVYVITSSTSSPLIVTLIAFYVREWRRLNFYASLPAILALLVVALLPRSPRWLLEKGKADEAHRVLQKAAKMNGKSIEFRLQSSPRREADRTYTYLDLARSWKPFRMTICLALLYFAIGLISYQVALQADKLGANIYISFVLSALADIPGFVASCYLCNKFGRKKSVLLSVFLSGIIMASIALISGTSSGSHTARLTLAILSKVTVGVANYGFFVWLFESFPTVIRGQGGAIAVSFHQVGIILVPLVNATTRKSDPLLVFVLIGVCAVVVSIIGCVLKETNNKPTRETYQDMLDGED